MSKKKKILILGGSSDIGKLVQKFLKNDYEVTAHYSKNKNNLTKIKKI